VDQARIPSLKEKVMLITNTWSEGMSGAKRALRSLPTVSFPLWSWPLLRVYLVAKPQLLPVLPPPFWANAPAVAVGLALA
jgi:hypothetical protein